MVEQKRAELKKHSHAEIWLDYWGYNVSHNDSDTLYQSPDERKNIQNACSTRCRVESFNLFKTKKTHMESRCRAIFPADLVQLYQKSAPRWKRKRNFCLLPFSFSLAGLLWLVVGGGALNGSDCALASSVSVFWLLWGLFFKIRWIIKETFDSIHSTKGYCWTFSYLLLGLISFQTYLKLVLVESKTFWQWWHADARPSETQWPHGYCTQAACEHSNDPKLFTP